MIYYHKGDLFKYVQDYPGYVLIPHVCNNIGGWGLGFVVALSKWCKTPERVYRSQKNYPLGHNIYARCDKHPKPIWVVNMVAQSGTVSLDNPRPLNYEALYKCMENIGLGIKSNDNPENYTIVAPKFGSHLAGGNWNIIEVMIEELWKDLEVHIYES